MLNQIQQCRSCQSIDLTTLFSLGNQYVNDFVTKENINNGHTVPIEIVQCQQCTLIQQSYTAPQDFLYTRHYWYRSGTTETMRNALADIVNETNRYVNLKLGDIVLDIGSNDGTLLRCYDKIGIVKVGVEPAHNLKEEGSKGIDLLINDFWDGDVYYNNFTNSHFNSLSLTGSIKPRVITACGMFYDLENPNQFIKDIADYLHPDGIFIAQLMCAKQMYDNYDIGNLCHEHLEFYTLESLRHLFFRNGLKIIEIQENNVNGGSYRLFIKHLDAIVLPDHQEQIDKVFQDEYKLHEKETWKKWIDDAKFNLQLTYQFIYEKSLVDKETIILGASTKGNTLLQTMRLDHNLISFASDKSPEKEGKYTIGTGIEIINEERARQLKPDYMLVLPYTFLQEFMERESELINQGTKFIVPLPVFKVI